MRCKYYLFIIFTHLNCHQSKLKSSFSPLNTKYKSCTPLMFLTGAVMGDLQSRRAMVEGIDSDGHFQKILARVPLAEMDGYSSSLRSITQGRAKFKMNFLAYESVPFDLQRKLIDEYSKTDKEEFA